MTDKAWKAFERRICKMFGGTRRGADYRSRTGGKNDCRCPGRSIECKLLSRPTFQQMFDACLQAENAAENRNDIPLAIVKKKYQEDKDALVIMRLERFIEFFG